MNKTDFLKKLITKTGLSMKTFSERANIPYTTLRSMLERGVENASVNNVIKICSTLNITIEDLYEMEEKTSNLISKEEASLLENYNKLNDLGKKEANKRVAELTEINKYKNNNDNDKTLEITKKQIWEEPGKEHLMPIASHDKDGEFTEEEFKHDDDIMNDDDLWK